MDTKNENTESVAVITHLRLNAMHENKVVPCLFAVLRQNSLIFKQLLNLKNDVSVASRNLIPHFDIQKISILLCENR